jgi:hypothetical protein
MAARRYHPLAGVGKLFEKQFSCDVILFEMHLTKSLCTVVQFLPEDNIKQCCFLTNFQFQFCPHFFSFSGHFRTISLIVKLSKSKCGFFRFFQLSRKKEQQEM